MDPTLLSSVSDAWVSSANYSANIVIDHFEIGIGAFYGQTTASEETIFKTLSYAADRGMTFWDTADIYGTCA